jgi:acyl-CoA thioester hydrolase
VPGLHPYRILGREMRKPLVFKTVHRIRFSDVDLYHHMSTARYAAYYLDHRLDGLRDELGWDMKALAGLPFMAVVRRLEIDFLRPVRGDQEITIRSFVRDFQGADAVIECAMGDSAGKEVSRCLMIVTYVDRGTNRPADWPDGTAALFFEKESA